MIAALLALSLAVPATATSTSTSTSTATATAGSTPTPELRDRVDSYLGAIDRPVTPAQWRALGPEAIPLLEAVVRGDELPTRRAAAIHGLAALGGERAQALILEVAAAEPERHVVRAAAIRSAGRVVAPGELAGALRPALEQARSPVIRAAAADALARSRDPVACDAVRAQAGREGAQGRERYAKALARCR